MVIAHTAQERNWMNEWGNSYTMRDIDSSRGGTWKGLEEDMRKNFGIISCDIYSLFLRQISRECRVLEIGCNRGHKLLLLQKLGFNNLYGIDINKYAVDISKKYIQNVNIIQESAFEIPFKNGYFDLVFTNGLLCFIHPLDIKKVLKEIYRCSNKYIFGVEMFHGDGYIERIRADMRNHCWKGNFKGLYSTFFPNLKLIKAITIDSLIHEEGFDNPLKVFLFKKERTIKEVVNSKKNK